MVLQSKKDLQDDKEPEIDTVQLIADAASKRMALLRAGIGAQTEGGGGVSQGSLLIIFVPHALSVAPCFYVAHWVIYAHNEDLDLPSMIPW